MSTLSPRCAGGLHEWLRPGVNVIETMLVDFAQSIGTVPFLLILAVVIYGLCFFGIPRTADMMVNASAGLAGKYLGNKWRTLAVNASTNNPELFSMVVAFAMLSIGGVANPLGSNFANIYLMYLFAPLLVMIGFKVKGKKQELAEFKAVAGKEKKLIAWHVSMALMMFVASSGVYWLLTGQLPIGGGGGSSEGAPETGEAALSTVPSMSNLFIAAGASFVAVVIFVLLMNKLNRKRPELTENIDDSEHTDSWAVFFMGTAGLIACVYVMNLIFQTCTILYQEQLSQLMGSAIFAGLHYFLGALVTSLPEMKVAMDNYKRRTSPDLNTALASASMSNMTNMAIALIGVLVAAALIAIFGNSVRV